MMKLICVIVLVLFSCSSENESHIIYFNDSSKKVNFTFGDVFTMIDSFTLNFTDEERAIPRIRQLYLNEQQEIFTGDYSTGTIVRFSSNGKYIEDIGNRGRGPGEFDFMGNCYVDSENNLWVFDSGQLRISRFKSPNYNYHDAFTIENRIGNFAAIGSEIVALSRNYDRIFKYSEQGTLLKEVSIEPSSQDLNNFLTRFNGGGLSHSGENSVFLIAPEKFEIHQYSQELELMNTIANGENNSRFRPNPPEFPKDLNPFDISNKHKQWYGTFLHIGRIFTFNNQGIIMVAVYKEDLLSDAPTQFFLNLYTFDGHSIAEGLKISPKTFPVAVQDNVLYLTGDEELLEDGQIKPTTIMKYQLNLSNLK